MSMLGRCWQGWWVDGHFVPNHPENDFLDKGHQPCQKTNITGGWEGGIFHLRDQQTSNPSNFSDYQLLDPRSGQLIHKILTKLISRISLNSALGHFEHSKAWCTAGQRLDVRFAVFLLQRGEEEYRPEINIAKGKTGQGLNSFAFLSVQLNQQFKAQLCLVWFRMFDL